MIALLSLVLAQIPIVSALGYSAAIVVVIAVAAATTLLPAILSLVGHRIESLRVPMVTPEHHDDQPHGWARWARGVARWPWPAMIGAVVIWWCWRCRLLDMKLGQEDVGQLPTDTDSRQAYDELSKGSGVGVNGPLLIAVDLKPPAHNDQQKLDKLNDQIAAQQQQAEQQVASLTEQLEEEGVPPDQAEQQAEAQVPGPSAAQQHRPLSRRSI